MGTPQFAYPAFEALALSPEAESRFEVCLVVSRPDARAGRGLKLAGSSISQAARAAGIELLQPPNLDIDGQAALVERLRSAELDFIVVAAYGMLLTDQIINAVRLGAVNIHASLLPRWRGAAPIERAILAGDAVTGVSIQQVRVELDSGPVYASAETPIAGKSSDQLLHELSVTGSKLLADCLPRIAAKELAPVEQDAALACYAAKLEPNELALDPKLTAAQNLLHVQAASRRTPARAIIAGRGVRVLLAGIGNAADIPAGTLLPGSAAYIDRQLLLAAADGWFAVHELQPDGRRAMDAQAFVSGLPSLRGSNSAAWSKWQ